MVAICQGPQEVGEVSLADLAFPPDTVAAWVHAAYRHYMGLQPFPARPRPGWTWPSYGCALPAGPTRSARCCHRGEPADPPEFSTGQPDIAGKCIRWRSSPAASGLHISYGERS
ncbi:protein of unknown function [Blastococcus saxobsidens DD2]|uniref:Uncharacterized protein n=1 Tax=Blastococcus saxobsidens (strain DD2) TaxID=1146883 RepID=H6RJU8_BLASD|nr:protein of unknown function [Blastococcus saxobsidens DD2]